MRWLYGFAVATAVFGVTFGGFFSGINATDPAVGQAAQPVICVSGCSGGGGAVFGPTATGSAAANPPVLIGGTVDGTATGLVQGAAVKPASTAPLATDPALVVASSPNSPDLGSYNVSGATAPSYGLGLGCIFQNSYVTLSNGQFGPLPCPGSGGVPPAPVAGFSASPTSSITRPANTTTYSANTGWCHTTSACATVFTFTGACRANGTQVLIPSIDLWLSDHQWTPLQGILWIFNVTPATVLNDDASFNIASGDFPNLTGSMQGFPFTMVSPQNSPNNSGVTLSGTTYPLQCASGSTTLYAMVQVVNAYVPTSAEVLNVTAHTVGVN